jgi:hypothetical protein
MMLLERCGSLLAFVAATAAPANLPTKPRSSLKWLSFYNDCPWGGENATILEPLPGAEPSLDVAAAVDGRSRRSESTTSASSGGPLPPTAWTPLPLLQGLCVLPGAALPGRSNWHGCWLDRLALANAQNSSAILSLQTSGPTYCGHLGKHGGYFICPDDCNYAGWNSTRGLVAMMKHGLRGPGAGFCGMAWLKKTLAWLQPHVAAGRLSGFMLGDELSGGMTSVDMAAVAAAVHAAMGGLDHFVYTNEGPHVFAQTSWARDKVPAGIDILSVDGYEAGKNESRWHKDFYHRHLFPALHPHQRVAVVPGLFGCADPGQAGGCDPNISTHYQRCPCEFDGYDLSLAGQSKGLIEKIDGFFEWAAAEPRLVGMIPWHYANRPSTMRAAAAPTAEAAAAAAWPAPLGGGSSRSLPAVSPAPPPPFVVNPGSDLGAAQYPELVEHLLALGWRNISQFQSASACGLVCASLLLEKCVAPYL